VETKKETYSQNNRRIAKNTLMLYIRMLLIMGVTLYTSRVVLNQLGVEDYGIYNAVGGVVIALAFLNGAMAQSTQRFLSFEIGRDNGNVSSVFNSAVIIHFIIGIGILFLAETLGIWLVNDYLEYPAEKRSAVSVLYQMSILTFFISVVQVPFNAAIIAREKMQIYAYFSVIEALLKLGAALSLAVVPGNTLVAYGFLIMLMTFINALMYIVYCYKTFPECRFRFEWNKPLLKKMLGFSVWNSLGHLVFSLKSQGLNIILNIFFGPLVNAAYSIALQVNNAICSFNQNFMTALNPQIVKTYAGNERDAFVSLVFRGCKISFFLILVISFPVLLNTSYILGIWLKNPPQNSIGFVQLIIINSLIESFTYTIGTAIQAKGKIRNYQLFVSGVNLLMLPISFILFKAGLNFYWGLYVLIVTSCASLIVRLFFLKKLLYISIKDYFQSVILKAAVILFISVIILLFLGKFTRPSIGNYFVLTFVGECLLFIVIWYCGLVRSERGFFINFIKEKIR